MKQKSKVWKMGCITLASWCIKRFPYWIRPFCNTNVTWHGEAHTLHNMYVAYDAPNYNTLRRMRIRTHLVVIHPNNCFRMSEFANVSMQDRTFQCDETNGLCILLSKQALESEYHTSIQCSTLDHTQPCFGKYYYYLSNMTYDFPRL